MARFEMRMRGGAVIIAAHGKLTRGGGEEALRQVIQDAINSGTEKIVLNLEGVTTMDEDGIGDLATCFAIATNRGAKLTLCCLQDKIRDTLEITGFGKVFDIRKGEDDAMRSFG